jgi:putative proteasome-type protease
MKCVLVSFDSTMRSNLSVGMPIDLACCERDSFRLSRYRFEPGDAYFSSLSKNWSEGVRDVFRHLPDVPAPKALPLPHAALSLQPRERWL